ADAEAEDVFGEGHLAIDRFLKHFYDAIFRCFVEKFGLLLADGADNFKRELNVRAFIAKNPIRPRGETLEQAARPEEIDISKRREEKETFNAAGEANEVEKDIATFVGGLNFVERLDGIDPFEAEICFAANRRDGFDGVECFFALVRIGDVSVEKREIK